MMKILKKAFKWYYKQFEEAYRPMINAGVMFWM